MIVLMPCFLPWLRVSGLLHVAAKWPFDEPFSCMQDLFCNFIMGVNTQTTTWSMSGSAASSTTEENARVDVGKLKVVMAVLDDSNVLLHTPWMR